MKNLKRFILVSIVIQLFVANAAFAAPALCYAARYKSVFFRQDGKCLKGETKVKGIGLVGATGATGATGPQGLSGAALFDYTMNVGLGATTPVVVMNLVGSSTAVATSASFDSVSSRVSSSCSSLSAFLTYSPAPGSGNTYGLYLRQQNQAEFESSSLDGTKTSLCTISDTTKSCSATANVSINEGDYLQLSVERISGNANLNFGNMAVAITCLAN